MHMLWELKYDNVSPGCETVSKSISFEPLSIASFLYCNDVCVLLRHKFLKSHRAVEVFLEKFKLN